MRIRVRGGWSWNLHDKSIFFRLIFSFLVYVYSICFTTALRRPRILDSVSRFCFQLILAL